MWLEVWNVVSSWPVAVYSLPFGVATLFAGFSLIGIAGEAVEVDIDGPDGDLGDGFFSFAGLPITLIFAMLSGFSWITALTLEVLVTPILAEWITATLFGKVAWGLAILAAGAVVALFATSKCAQLLAPLYYSNGPYCKAIIGKTAVASLSVTESHGQARYIGDKGTSDITLQVISDEKDLGENDIVSIVDYDLTEMFIPSVF